MQNRKRDTDELKIFIKIFTTSGLPLVVQMVKNPPAVQETWVRSLGGKISWRVEWHSRILDWRIPGTEEPGGLQSTGSQRGRQDLATNTFAFHMYVLEVYNEYNENKKYDECNEIQF